MSNVNEKEHAIGIIGGTGLYSMAGFEQTEEKIVDTPFGAPSDALVGGVLAGRKVWFLPRHGRGHTLLPHEINHRANIWALKSLGVSYILCVNAVGSLREEYAPRDIVVIDQYFDRTSKRAEHTFFGEGIAAHVQFADPVSEGLKNILLESARAQGCTAHDGGTYVNMDGPAFSTRAESNANRQLGHDVIGMTNLPEAKLAREAEIALATLAMITDYDCWKVEEEPVSLQTVLGHLSANSKNAEEIVARAVANIPLTADWPEHSTLEFSIVTPKDLWKPETVAKLQPLLAKYLE